ncbi:MAG: glycosyl hydrolase family 18 protein [Acidaminococcus intestini]
MTNSFDPDLTHKFLQDPHAQRFIIDQLLKEAETHGFDGINIDFENIYEKDRDALTSFMAYLRRQSQKKGLILSMDVTAPSRNPNWSRCYDRKALTKSVDYLVLMTYDQFSRLSKVPGPTASFNWDEKKVQETLAQGVPRKNFYLVSHFICAYGRPRKAPRSIGREPLVCGRPSSSFMIKRTFRPSGRPGSQRKR